MVEVRRLIQTRKLTQRSAANLLGVTKPRISDLIRRQDRSFSIDTLVNMLARAGMRVQLRIAGGRRSPRTSGLKSPIWLGQVGVLSLAARVLFHYPRRPPRGIIRSQAIIRRGASGCGSRRRACLPGAGNHDPPENLKDMFMSIEMIGNDLAGDLRRCADAQDFRD